MRRLSRQQTIRPSVRLCRRQWGGFLAEDLSDDAVDAVDAVDLVLAG